MTNRKANTIDEILIKMDYTRDVLRFAEHLSIVGKTTQDKLLEAQRLLADVTVKLEGLIDG